jgi:hypothetical protein
MVNEENKLTTMKLSEYKLRGWSYKKLDKQLAIGDKHVLLLSVDTTNLGFKGLLKNLIAVDKEENILWIANLPTGFTLGYVYNDIQYDGEHLKAWMKDLVCEIDTNTGRIIAEELIR